MTIKLGPITSLEIDGQDMTHCISSVTLDRDAIAPGPAACDWETLRDALAEPDPTHPRVIDQDGNPVRPPASWLRNAGRS